MSTEPRDPLNVEERDLARVLRALPGGEPPSALDMKILAAARDALEETPAPAPGAAAKPGQRRWGVGLGVAASAVLAVGIAWRLQTNAPDAAFSAAPQDTAAAESAEGFAAPPAAPPAAAAAGVIASTETEQPERKAVAPAVAMPPPPEEPPVVFDDSRSLDLAATPSMADALNQADAAVLAAEEAMLESPPQAMPAPPAPPPPPALPSLDRTAPAPATPPVLGESSRSNELTERRQRAEVQSAPAPAASGAMQPLPLPAVEDDFALYPESWLIRIEERRRAGDLQGATQSLAAFRARYPAYPIPEALQPLLHP